MSRPVFAFYSDGPTKVRCEACHTWVLKCAGLASSARGRPLMYCGACIRRLVAALPARARMVPKPKKKGTPR